MFKCWNTEPDGSGIEYYPGDTITDPGTTTPENPYVTLYAQWEYHPSLRYNSNHELSIETMPDTIFSSDLIVEESAFTVEQYRFTHWNTKPDGSGTDYYPGDTISDPGTTTPENPYVDLYVQWEEAFPIVGYDANGASGSMPNSKVNDSYVIPPCSFYCPGYAFVSWNTQQNGKGTSYRPGEKLDQELDIPSSGNSVSLTLYAQWEEQKVDFDSDTNTYSFSLRGGQSMTFNNVPAGTTYTVYEETQNGWVPIEMSGDTGSIEPLSTSVAHFVNDRREKFAQTVIPGNKLLDGKPAAGFVFELIENDSVVATATSDENGLFEFKMEYTEPGNHSYIVREKLLENADVSGIVYDEHVAEVTIYVTENADGTLNLYSTLPKDSDGEIDKPLDPDELGVSTVAGKYYRVSDSSMSWSVASYPVQILKGNGTAYSTTFSAWNKYIISPGTVDGTWICTTTISGVDNIPLNEIIIPNGSYAIVSYEKDGDAQAVEPLGIKVGDILSFSNGISANIEDAAGAGDISIMKPFSKPDGYDVYEKIPVFRTSTTAVDDLSLPLQILSGASVSYPVNAQNCLDATNNPPKSLSVMGPYRAGQNYIDPITNTKSGNYGWSRALFEPVDINGKTYYKFVRYYSTNSTGDDVKPTIDIDGAIVVVYHPNTYTSPLFAAGDIISFDFDLECVARPLTGTGQSWPSNAPVIGNLLFVPKITGASLTDWNKYRIVPSDQHPNCYEVVEKCSDGLSVTSIELTEGEKMVAVPSGDDTFENLRDGALYSFDFSLDAEQASADGIGYAYYIAPSFVPPDGGEDPEPEILTGLSFKNTSKPGSLTVSKTVNGTANSVNPDHEFTFKVTLNEGLEDERVEVLKIKAGEQASIDNIPAGTRYKVEETDLPTGYAVSHITNDSGTVTGGSHIEVQADNTYQSHGEALISGKKTLLGRELVGNDFTFELVRESDGTPISTASNDMGGSFSFIVEADGSGEDFTETYLLRENTSEADISPDLRGKVDFDNRIWTIDVSWHDNGLGVLIPTVTYRSDADDNDEQAEIATFDNTMKTGTLHVEKSMSGISDEMKDFEFEFDLSLVGDNGEAYEPISWLRSDGDSSSESYSDHVIYLSAGQSIDIEIPSGVAYRVSERSVDKIVLLSSEGTEGTIEASSTSNAYFENGYIVPPYSAEGEIGIPVSKKLMNGDLADGQFRFVMLAPDGQEYRAYNDVNGVVSFPTLMFDETDDGKEFLYQIFELSGEEGRIIYDMDIRNVLIVPHDNGDGTVSCQMSMLSEDETISAPIDEVKFINQALLDGEVILPGSGSNGAIVLVIALGLLLFWSGYAYRRRKRKAILLFSNT